MREAFYLFGGVIALTFIAVCWMVGMARRRTKQMAGVARKLGFSFEPDGHALLEQRGLSEAPLFALASICHGRISNVLTGKAGGVNLTVLDFSYQTGGTAGEQRDYAQTAVCVAMEGLPTFTLHPGTDMPPRFALKITEVLAGIGKPLSGGDPRWQLLQQAIHKIEEPGIEFETHPKFTSTYRLRSPDGEAVRSLFQPAMLDFFERQEQTPVAVESAANWLIVYRHKQLVRPSETEAFLDETAAISRLFSSGAGHPRPIDG